MSRRLRIALPGCFPVGLEWGYHSSTSHGPYRPFRLINLFEHGERRQRWCRDPECGLFRDGVPHGHAGELRAGDPPRSAPPTPVTEGWRLWAYLGRRGAALFVDLIIYRGDQLFAEPEPESLVEWTVRIDRNGDVHNDTLTFGNSYADVYRGFQGIKAELDRQIAERRECPYNPKYGKKKGQR